MTEIERAAIEYERCFKDPYYFFKTYCTVTTKKEMVEREEIIGSEYDEVKHICLMYYVQDNERETFKQHIYKIEKLTHHSGDVAYVFYFNGKYSKNKSAIDRDEKYLSFLRKEKLEKICQIK